MPSLRAHPSTTIRQPPTKTMQEGSTEVPLYRIAPRSASTSNTENPVAHVEVPELTGKVIKYDNAIGGGLYSDVFKGTCQVNGNAPMKVAIKVLRPHTHKKEDMEKLDKRLRKEIRIWGNLDHQNIIALCGVALDFGDYPSMISQWMDQGSLDSYLDDQRLDLDLRGRVNICITIAEGLSYLHSKDIIHGDLHPGNILMDGDVAHLSDFGLSNVIADLQGQSFFTTKVGGSARWIAPELLLATDENKNEITPTLTKSCDVYSFASVALYAITRNIPFARIKNNNVVIMAIMKTIQAGSSPSPPRPTPSLLTDECWNILMECWKLNPTARPNISTVENRLRLLKNL